MRLNFVIAVLALLLVSGWQPVAAQGTSRTPENFRISVGGGVLLNPTYDGDDAYQLSLLPNTRIQWRDRFIASVQEGISYRLIKTDRWAVGPIARLNFGRDEADGTSPFRIFGDDTNDLTGLGDIGAALELGGFARYSARLFSLTVEGRKALGGHDGYVGDITLRFRNRVQTAGLPVFLSGGPRVRLADGRYTQAFFGITPEQSALSGLTSFDPDGGLVSAGLGFSAAFPIGSGITAAFISGYDRFLGDVDDSPLIVERGSPNQFSVGLFFTVDFDL